MVIADVDRVAVDGLKEAWVRPRELDQRVPHELSERIDLRPGSKLIRSRRHRRTPSYDARRWFGRARLEPAATGRHGRLEIEARSLTLSESRFALAALRLPHDPQLAESLRRLLRRASPTTLAPMG